MPSTRRYLVTGARGFVGSHVVERLIRRGHDVRAFVRYTSDGGAGLIESIHAATEVIRGDLRDQDAVRRAMRGADAVVHLGARCGIPT